MTVHLAPLPLDWPALCARVGRPWLSRHRGALPIPRLGTTALDAPVGVAACAQLGERQVFVSEKDGETWRWVGPRALNVSNAWAALRYEREDVRISVGIVRYWRACGDASQAELGCCELRRRWSTYRRGMRRLAAQLNWVRDALTLRRHSMNTAPSLQAAE